MKAHGKDEGKNAVLCGDTYYDCRSSSIYGNNFYYEYSILYLALKKLEKKTINIIQYYSLPNMLKRLGKKFSVTYICIAVPLLFKTI